MKIKLLGLLITAMLLGNTSRAACIADIFYVADTSSIPYTYYFYGSGSTGSHLGFYWTFGDGDSSWLMNPTHQYPANGIYTICLTVKDSTDTTCVDTYCININANKQPCFAGAFYTIDSSVVPKKYQFFGFGSGGSALKYRWTFGDSTSSNLKNPAHQYNLTGTYQVCLYVTDSVDTICTASTCFSISVTKVPCQAVLNYTIDSSGSPKKYFFSANGSGGTRLKYYWNFGDSSYSTLKNPPYHQYAPGTYNVCLMVRDSVDTTCSSTKCTSVTISGIPCTARYNYTIDTIPQPDIYSFNSNASTGDIKAWLWNFGDSTTSVLPNPTHQFFNSAAYNVCLTVSNAMDSTCAHTSCSTVVVTIPPPCQANFTVYTDTAFNPGRTYFTNTSTGAIVSCLWSFGDSSGFNTQISPIYQYQNAGFYTVCLTVTGSDSTCNSTKCSTIYIPPPCRATFSHYFDTLTPGGAVRFFPVYGKNGTTYHWNFGDGDSSSLMHPVHHYASTGWFNVCLTINHPAGACTHTYCDSVISYSTSGKQRLYREKDLVVYPNPFDNSLRIEFTSENSAAGIIQIMDAVGKLYMTKPLNITTGKNVTLLHLESLPKGVYLMELKLTDQTLIKRILK